MVWYLWKTFMRHLAGLIIEIDPIAILKSYIQDLEKKSGEMWDRITELAGAEQKLGDKIRKNDEDAEALLRLASKAKEMGKMEAAQLDAMKAGGLKTMNEKLQPLYNNMERLHAFLDKAYKAADFVIKQAKIQVELKEAEYEAVKTGSKALHSAMSILKGDPDKRAMFEQSLEYIQDDMANKVAEMKRIMDFSTEFIDNADIETGVNYDKGMALLDSYEKGMSLLAPVEGGQATLPAGTPASSIGMSAKVPATRTKGGSEWD